MSASRVKRKWPVTANIPLEKQIIAKNPDNGLPKSWTQAAASLSGKTLSASLLSVRH
jgi:hypothetical protein